MKIMFTPDIYGSAYYHRRILDICEETGAERLILLEDILYHGPRSDLPRDYAPKKVIAALNPMKSGVYAVRGGCDAEVDRMALDSPIVTGYGLFMIEGGTFHATHGHVSDQDRLSPMEKGDILVYGHTHFLRTETADSTPYGRVTVLNPGSVSIPKGGNPHAYAMSVGGMFRILTLDGGLVKEIKL